MERKGDIGGEANRNRGSDTLSIIKSEPPAEQRTITSSPSLRRGWVRTHRPFWFAGSGRYHNEELELISKEEVGESGLNRDEVVQRSGLGWRPTVLDHRQPPEEVKRRGGG
ncbi:hypothetical protein F2Q69_00051769 [Brassica cretica]|uniref:Uncharacterized protein n=1 Tax=Brassica cretica TaxID=69181 RepID=A0A8S9PRG9_BRACR|nr:hypothetical protein F2Q69_00051769 [Brassica cretica]